MRVEELRTGLDQLAGRAPAPPSGGAQRARRTARRRRAAHVTLAVCAIVLAVAVGALTLSHDGSGRVSPVDTTPTTVPPRPPDADPRAIFDQPRIGVSDSTGKVRGTIPTAAYKAAMGITADGSPPPAPDNTPVPVLTDAGDIDGYWLPCGGFVERSVVERKTFDADAYCATQKTKDEANYAKWWAGLTPEQRQQSEDRGLQPPPTTLDAP